MAEEKVVTGKNGDDQSDQNMEGQASFTPEEERRILRKIDCVILPMVKQQHIP